MQRAQIPVKANRKKADACKIDPKFSQFLRCPQRGGGKSDIAPRHILRSNMGATWESCRDLVERKSAKTSEEISAGSRDLNRVKDFIERALNGVLLLFEVSEDFSLVVYGGKYPLAPFTKVGCIARSHSTAKEMWRVVKAFAKQSTTLCPYWDDSTPRNISVRKLRRKADN
ncbi:hypothetical protein B0H11DRAFT_2323564 [Mycena galericulata]|nr:hypothetical protein B0H11DRAFT_2323564 [Mycena galericulata]